MKCYMQLITACNNNIWMRTALQCVTMHGNLLLLVLIIIIFQWSPLKASFGATLTVTSLSICGVELQQILVSVSIIETFSQFAN
jgi:hypothetical protein